MNQSIEETHQLIDKIERRVKNFIKVSSQKTIVPSKKLPDLSFDASSRPSYSHQQQQNPLLKEIQDIDESYRLEIQQLNVRLNEYRDVVENLRSIITEQQQKLIYNQNSIEKLESELQKEKILVQTLRDENDYVTTEMQKLINKTFEQTPICPKLHKEIMDEKLKSDKLQGEILDIKSKVEKQRDSARVNQDSIIIEKLVKKLEDAQQQQVKQNQQFMKSVLNYLEKPQSHNSSIRASSASINQQQIRKSKPSAKKKY